MAEVDNWARERGAISRMLKDNLQIAQGRMKFYADKNRSEREFALHD